MCRHGITGVLSLTIRRRMAAFDGIRTALAAAAVLILWASSAIAAEYDFSGGDFTSVSGIYTTSDEVTGDVIFSSPLPTSSVISAFPTGLTAFPIQSGGPTISLPGSVSFSFNDGINTITNSNASSWGITLDTNSAGQIIDSNLTFDRTYSPTHTVEIAQILDPSDPGSDESYGLSADGSKGGSAAGQGYNFTAGMWSGPKQTMSLYFTVNKAPPTSQSKQPTSINAELTLSKTMPSLPKTRKLDITVPLNVVSLRQLAKDLHVATFDWVQIVNMAAPGAAYTNAEPNVRVTGYTNDSPPSGWTYAKPANPYPFYYEPPSLNADQSHEYSLNNYLSANDTVLAGR
jgi:hypothetical protein